MRRRLRQLKRLGETFVAYQQRQTRGLKPPFRLWIELTNVCNLKCVMCPTGLGLVKPPGFMKFELFRQIVDEGRDYIYDVNLHHRGESLLHPHLGPMIRYASASGLRTNLHTNATLLTKEIAEVILESGLDLLSFSVDGYEAETYERIRRRGDFEQTVHNIISFLELKKKRGCARPFTVLEALKFPGEEHEGRVRREFRRRFVGLPLNGFVEREVHNCAGDVPFGRRAGSEAPKRFAPCTFPWYSLTILWEGTVVPCPQDFRARYPLGNLQEARLLEIWDGEELCSLRARLVHREVDQLEACVGCDRLRRRTLLGLPTTGWRSFLRENL